MLKRKILQRMINHLDYCLNIKGRRNKIHILDDGRFQIKTNEYNYIFELYYHYNIIDGFAFKTSDVICRVSIRSSNELFLCEYRFPVLTIDTNDFLCRSIVNIFLKEKREDFINKNSL